MYQLYRRLLEPRRAHPALASGAYRLIVAEGDLLLFVRELDSTQILVALNLGGEPVAANFPSGSFTGRVLLSSFVDRAGEDVRDSLELRPSEGMVVEIREQRMLPNASTVMSRQEP
jgi:alpha-glucosidase